MCNVACVCVECLYVCLVMYVHLYCAYVTEFAKRGLIHAFDFPTLTRHNFIGTQAIRLKISVLLVQ